MRTIENDIPEIFLELAREGFVLGLAEVSVGFWYLGVDFISPIEWALWLTKRESQSGAREYIHATMGRGQDGPTAYIASTTGDFMDATYWGPEEIRKWMREPLEAEGEYTLAWKPIEDPDLQRKFLAQWPLFEAGVRSGWTMKRKASWNELAIFKRALAKRDSSVEGEFDGLTIPSLGLGWDITNSFYNTEGHPDHRSTGANISVGGWSLVFDGEEEKFYSHGVDSPPRPVALTWTEAEELLNTNHRWFVRVAVDDEETGEWLHFPEALKDPDETVSATLATTQNQI